MTTTTTTTTMTMTMTERKTNCQTFLSKSQNIRQPSRIRQFSISRTERRRASVRNGARLALVMLSMLQMAIWIHPSQLRVYGFGRIAQNNNRIKSNGINSNSFVEKIRIKKSESFFDSFRKVNSENKMEDLSTQLYFAPTGKTLDTDTFKPHHYHRTYSYPLSPSLSLTSFTTRSLMVLMGQKGGSKGDKQNKKPKTKNSAASSPSPSPSPAASTPQRVSNQINVPIRRQIRYGKINKQLREAAASGSAFRQTKKGNFVAVSGPGGAGPIKRTSYRKQLDEETIQQKALERQRKGQDPDWSVVLNQTKADPLVLVDGYNVIYKWARLKKHMVRGDTDRARQLLLEDLEGLASLQRWRIECVFDGAGRAGIVAPLGSGPGNSNSNSIGTNPTLSPFGRTGTVRAVFTGRNIEADTYIEGRCAAAKNVTMGLTTSSLIVATDDSQIKLVANSAGALCMSSDRFVLELKAVKKGMQYRVEKAMSEVNNEPMRHESQWGNPSNAASAKFFGGSASIGSSSGDDYKNKPKREVVQENADGSKLVMARYGANEILIKDNRNKKPKRRPPTNGTPKKKKKKKKKK